MPEEINKSYNTQSEGLGLCLRMLGVHGSAVSKSGEDGVISGCSIMPVTDRRTDPGDDGLGLGIGLWGQRGRDKAEQE